MKKVGIIGGSGFIVSYITRTFLENNYQVKVSATDITREDKYQHLMNLKNYLLSSETYKVSDVHLMLNHQEPKEQSTAIYKNDLAKRDLGISFRPVKETLNNYSK